MSDTFGLIYSSSPDAPAIARILRVAMKTQMPYLPDLHTPEEDLAFIRDVVFPKCRVLAANVDGEIVGLCAYREGWIDHLYILPEYQGQGIGSALLARAKDEFPRFELWAFQRNIRARRFYENRGFILAELTDGQGNQEKEPDVRYVWERVNE
jgi:GNAT superfamily N-acetyltransferase